VDQTSAPENSTSPTETGDAQEPRSEDNTPASRAMAPPYLPIVYVRGFAMTPAEREQVFHDAYYGFAATSVEKRQAPPTQYFAADIFEGQLMRLVKEHGYVDATNAGIANCATPERSIWISRFYDVDFFQEKARTIEAHAEDLRRLILDEIPAQLAPRGVDTRNYKIILVAHSMGGLVCRALIQNILPKAKRDPKEVVHRFVTMGTPHGGIDLSALPSGLQNWVIDTFNPFDAAIFEEKRMREYLNLAQRASGQFVYDVHSLGDSGFPIERCLCLIGSDYQSYGAVRHATGSFSDGLVKQDRAYVVSGPRTGGSQYPEKRQGFYANVHRAHSGFRGIVNSYESYENIQRFLFGDTIFRLSLEEIELRTRREHGLRYFYDFEFTFSIRGTSSYLHRRQQLPCENAIRVNVDGAGPPTSLHLHTGFFNTKLRRSGDPYSNFLLNFRVAEHRVRDGIIDFFDRDYPDRQIYNEALEARVGGDDPKAAKLQYRWLSDTDGVAEQATWLDADLRDDRRFSLKLRNAASFGACLCLEAAAWPDPGAAGLSHRT